MTTSIIVALSENNVIGINNKLPWKLSADLKHVKTITMGHHLIMGRKTFESFGKALPGRTNIIITQNKDFKAEGCVIVGSLAEALKIPKDDNEVFIFGGGEIFREALPKVDNIYMTRVHVTLQGDTYFPQLNSGDWNEVKREDFQADEKNDYDFSFITLERKNKLKV